MSLIKEVTVLSQHELRLDIEAKVGDIIDLLQVNKVDTSILVAKIKAATDEEYSKRLQEMKKQLNSESEYQTLLAIENYKKQVTELEQQLQLQQSIIESTLRTSFEKEKSEISLKIQELQSQLEKEEAKRQTQLDQNQKANELELFKETVALNNQIELLKKEINEKEYDVKQALEADFERSKGEFKEKIAKLESEKQALNEKIIFEKNAAVAEKEKALNETIYNLKAQINDLEHEKEIEKGEVKELLNEQIKKLEFSLSEKEQKLISINESKETAIQLAVAQKEKELNESLASKDQQIAALTLTRSLLNIKKQGEKLESWCNNEYESYAQNGFDTCKWEKDNEIVKADDESKGTKADYIFKVFASNQFDQKELITSVVCEMKSEDPSSQNKKKNSAHFGKLEKDRKDKNCEYALLISELEWDQDNDIPIRKVQDHEKMYVVRPTFFVSFLSVIASLGLKYKEILGERRHEEEEFVETQTILNEFERMKNDIIDINLVRIQKQIENIKNNSDKLRKIAFENDEAIDKIFKEAIEQIKKKIENFNIRKITNKINKLE